MTLATTDAQQDSWEMMEKVVLTGDLKTLTPEQRVRHLRRGLRAARAGLADAAVPVHQFRRQAPNVPWQRAADQLSAARGISTSIRETSTIGDVYYVEVEATVGTRRVHDVGIVAIEGLKGVAKANAMKKAVTQARRRAILALVGLGMPDDSEVDDIPGSVRVQGQSCHRESLFPPRQSRIAAAPAHAGEGRHSAPGEPLGQTYRAKLAEGEKANVDDVCLALGYVDLDAYREGGGTAGQLWAEYEAMKAGQAKGKGATQEDAEPFADAITEADFRRALGGRPLPQAGQRRGLLLRWGRSGMGARSDHPMGPPHIRTGVPEYRSRPGPAAWLVGLPCPRFQKTSAAERRNL